MIKTALVCDDDDGILDVICTVLESEKIKAVTESNSLNLFKKIEEQRPDIILLDLWMPELSGDEITKKLKNNPLTSDIPVIIISASRDGNKIAQECGAEEFIKKPFDIEYLVDKVNYYLNSKMTA